MGLIGDAFGKLFKTIGNMFSGLFSFLGNLFTKLFSLLWEVIKWLGNFIKKLFQGLIDILISFFQVIYALIDGILYLIYKIGVLAVKLFQVIFEVAKLIWALAVGFARTLASLHYTPRAGSGNGYSSIIGKLFNNMEVLQIDVLAYILLFVIWFITAIAAMKLLSSIRVGGD